MVLYEPIIPGITAKARCWLRTGQAIRSPHPGLKDGFFRPVHSKFNDSVNGGRFPSHDLLRPVSLPSLHIGLRDIATIARDASMNKQKNATISSQTYLEQWNSGPPLQDDGYYQPLGPTEVEVEAKAGGLDFHHVFIALGRLEESDFGPDCSGIVTRVGSQGHDAPAIWSACAQSAELSLTRARIDSISSASPRPCLWTQYVAYSRQPLRPRPCLVETARLRKGEKVLIHAASGATGQLAIQVAKLVGAEIFATVGFDAKKQFLKDTYNLSEDHIFFSRNTSFAKVSEGLRASWECVAPYGQFVEIRKADINDNAALPMACSAKNVSFFGLRPTSQDPIQKDGDT
ncbi:hypothetical protein F4778DRAFT_779127 [Xylariomycetidae sp. FL2044]|nr:hypothetical protein F4778DRAFT_779127 [Xylariomycetidae sp. FL2044]